MWRDIRRSLRRSRPLCASVRLLYPSCGTQSDTKRSAKKRPNSSSKPEDPRAHEREVGLRFPVFSFRNRYDGCSRCIHVSQPRSFSRGRSPVYLKCMLPCAETDFNLRRGFPERGCFPFLFRSDLQCIFSLAYIPRSCHLPCIVCFQHSSHPFLDCPCSLPILPISLSMFLHWWSRRFKT